MRKLIKFIESNNIAEDLDDSQLSLIGERVIEQYEEDWQSMEDWRNLVDKGIELATPDVTPKSQPWQNAANYKYNGMLGSAIDFGHRASNEILRERDLFMTDIIGKDKDDIKKQKAERIEVYENAHINYKMDDWREQQAKVCYTLPAYGTCFKKVYYDTLEDKKVSALIQYPNFAIHQGTTSLDDCRSFTQIHDYSMSEANVFQAMGIWLDVDIESDGSNDTLQAGSNEAEGVKNAESNPCRYFEQHTFLDLDEDGIEEPYIVTVHELSGKVLRIVADYTYKDVIMRGEEIFTLEDARKQPEDVQAEIFKSAQMVKIKRGMDVVKYGFIRSIDGTFLDIGYFYLLSAITNLINTNTNQLVDAGTLANRQSGWLSKEFRKTSGLSGFKPGEWKKTDIPAVQMNGAVQPLPVKEPSITLLNMMEGAKNEVKEFAMSLDMSGLMQANTAATTALVAVQEQLVPASAIMKYMLEAQSKEFVKLSRLTPIYCKDEDYKDITGETDASIENDYDDASNIKPTAQKLMSNQTVRMFDAQAQLEYVPLVLQAGGNPIPIIKNYYDLLEYAEVDEIFPEMTPEQEAQQAELMRIEQKKQAQLLDLQLAKEMKAVEAFKAEQEAFLADEQRKTAKLEAELEKLRSEIAKNAVETENTKADTAKTMEEAKAQAIENNLITSGAMEIIEKSKELEKVVEVPEREDD